MVALAQKSKDNDQLNRLEEAMAQLPQQEIPTVHVFTPGLYARTVLMRKGSVFTSKIHRTEHPFIVSLGSCTVVDGEGNRVLIRAPHLGITQPGTRRALHIHEDCIWTTFHTTPHTDVDLIEQEIIEPHHIPQVRDGSRAQVDIYPQRALEANH